MANKHKLKEYERVLQRNLFAFLKYLFAWSVKRYRSIPITSDEVHKALEFANAMQKGNIETNEQLSQEEKEKLQAASDIEFANFEKNLKENVLKEIACSK